MVTGVCFLKKENLNIVGDTVLEITVTLLGVNRIVYFCG